jgi:cytochrome o ubiquinol oxidase operon protein cyoD
VSGPVTHVDYQDPGHSHGHDHGHGHGETAAAHGTRKGYVIGFLLSVVLTAIPFWLVMGKVLERPGVTGALLLGLAAVQIVVHMVYFLHMNAKSEGGWSLLALIFTIVLVVIALSGSLWVMYHLNENMMPSSMPDMRNMP